MDIIVVTHILYLCEPKLIEQFIYTTGTSYGSGTYVITASSYSDTSSDMSLMFDYAAVVTSQSAVFSPHYSTATGDFTFNGDPRFTLDGSYYGWFLTNMSKELEIPCVYTNQTTRMVDSNLTDECHTLVTRAL